MQESCHCACWNPQRLATVKEDGFWTLVTAVSASSGTKRMGLTSTNALQ